LTDPAEPHAPKEIATPPSNQVVAAIERLAEQLDHVDADALRGEFAADGVGRLGAAYRAMATAKEYDLPDAWGALLEILKRLWETGAHDAALAILEVAVLRVPIPDDMAPRIQRALRDTRIAARVWRVEKRFDHGDDEEAVALSRTIDAPDASEYSTLLLRRIAARRRLRIICISVGVIASVAMTGLSAVSAIGFYQSVISQPGFTLPPPPPAPGANLDLRLPPAFLPLVPAAEDGTSRSDEDDAALLNSVGEGLARIVQNPSMQMSSSQVADCGFGIRVVGAAVDLLAAAEIEGLDTSASEGRLEAYKQDLSSACDNRGIALSSFVAAAAAFSDGDIFSSAGKILLGK
jgi:hypothetical protein